jgi:suppressor of ftsI
MTASTDPTPARAPAPAPFDRRAALRRAGVAGIALGTLSAAGWQLTARARQDATPAASPQVPGKDQSPDGHDHAATPTAGPDRTPVADPVAFGFIPGEEFADPPVRQSENGVLESTLTASFGPAIVAGREVTTLCYEGSLPGPTLLMRPGDTLKLRVTNEFDQPTNLHTHGLHVSPSGNSDNVFVDIEPGESFDYEIVLPTNHPPGSYWYHPHYHGNTHRQVALGLAGMMVVDGVTDLVPELASYPTKIIAIQSTQFDTTGMVLPTRLQFDPLTLINGQWQPVIRLQPGEIQRWLLANLTSGIVYNVALASHALHQIAADGNAFDAPQLANSIVLSPGERADVLVKAFEIPGTYELRSVLWGEGFQATADLLLATVIIEGEPIEAAPMPEYLVSFEDLSQYQVDRQRSLVFQIVDDDDNPYLIDGRMFDHERVDQRVPLNALEEWLLINTSSEWHPFHIHVNDFQVVAINGEPRTAHGYDDTFMIPPNGSITIRSRFLDFTGRFVYHCHFLYHEDHSMMGVVEVVE